MTTSQPPTVRQQIILDFIREYIRREGYSPAIRDIMHEFGFASPNSVVCHLTALEKKGLLSRSGPPGGQRHARSFVVADDRPNRWTLPLLGRVAAGPPIAGDDAAVERLDFRHLFGEDGTFLYRVPSRSLEANHVAAGDYLVLRPLGRGDSGRTVAAVVDGEIGLFDYLTGKAGKHLSPKPRTGPPLPAGEADVLGVLTGVVRKA